MKFHEWKFWTTSLKRANGCIEWTGHRNRTGYGRTQKNGKTWFAHRLAWHLSKGEIPKGMQVNHCCDNPPCINPMHLFIGSQLDNQKDASKKNRIAHGERSPLHVLSNAQVRKVLKMLMHGVPHRTIAAEFGVCKATITHINTGRNWNRLWSDIKYREYKIPNQGRQAKRRA